MPIRKLSGRLHGTGRETGEVPAEEAAADVGLDHMTFSDKGRRYFGDLGFPTTREKLYASALVHGAPPRMLDAIRNLPRRYYKGPDALPDLYALSGLTQRDDEP